MRSISFILLSLALIGFGCGKEDFEENDTSEDDTSMSENCNQNFANPNFPSTWQPWDWNGYEKFPSLYFAACPDGFMDATQLEKVSKHSLAIIEFRASQWDEEESTGLWAGSMYERQWEALQDQSLFIENENHCQGVIS